MVPTNEERADMAYSALEHFAEESGQDRSGCLENDPQSVISDLIANLMHLCNENGMDFAKILTTATMNFEAEEEEGDCEECSRSYGPHHVGPCEH